MLHNVVTDYALVVSDCRRIMQLELVSPVPFEEVVGCSPIQVVLQPPFRSATTVLNYDKVSEHTL